MKTLFSWILLVIIVSVNLSSTNWINPDKPQKGIWNLEPQQVWTIEKAGEDLLSMPDLLVSDGGLLFIRDWKNKKSYLFNNQGQFLKTYGRGGEGPGEIKQYLGGFLVNGKQVLADIDKLHYFTEKGDHIKSVANNFWQCEPQFFIDTDQFIAAPSYDVSLRNGEIQYVQLDSGKKRTIKAIPASAPEKLGNSPRVILIGLNPQIILGYDIHRQKVIYGINNKYQLHIMDLQGKVEGSFSVRRQQKTVPYKKIKRETEVFGGESLAPRIIKALPNKLSHFHKIQVIGDLIFVFHGNFGLHWGAQEIDIFSVNGRYLYRTSFSPEGSTKIYFSRSNIVIKQGHLYAVLEDDNGDVKVVKYMVKLPEHNLKEG